MGYIGFTIVLVFGKTDSSHVRSQCETAERVSAENVTRETD